MDQKLKNQSQPSGPVTVRNYKFWVDRDLCIGAGTCVAMAAKTYALDDETKAVILETADQDSDTALIDAAKSCPVSAILVTDLDGSRIYPK